VVSAYFTSLSAAQVQSDEFPRRYWLRLVAAAAHHLKVLVVGDDER
jgi:hypothetical protein